MYLFADILLYFNKHYLFLQKSACLANSKILCLWEAPKNSVYLKMLYCQVYPLVHSLHNLSQFLVYPYNCVDCGGIINLSIRSKTNDLKFLQSQFFHQGLQDWFHQCWSITNFRKAPNLCHSKQQWSTPILETVNTFFSVKGWISELPSGIDTMLIGG